MPNINNNTETFIPVGANVNTSANPAVFAIIPDDATGILFTFTAGGSFTLDGTTPTVTIGFFCNVLLDPYFLHLYPGARIDFFANAGFLNYQFIRTGDHHSLTSRR